MVIERSYIIDLVFDDGELNEHPENARKEVQVLTKLMKSSNPIIYSAEQYPLRHVFQSVWQRIKKVIFRYIHFYYNVLSLNESFDADISGLEIFPWYGVSVASPRSAKVKMINRGTAAIY